MQFVKLYYLPQSLKLKNRRSLPNIDIPTSLLQTSNTENSKAYSKVIELFLSVLLLLVLKV